MDPTLDNLSPLNITMDSQQGNDMLDDSAINNAIKRSIRQLISGIESSSDLFPDDEDLIPIYEQLIEGLDASFAWDLLGCCETEILAEIDARNISTLDLAHRIEIDQGTYSTVIWLWFHLV